MSAINNALQEFKPQDTTVRMLETIYGAIPGGPAFPHYFSLHATCQVLGASKPQIKAAQKISAHDSLNDILWMSRLLDTGDRSYMMLTGVKSAFKLFFGKRDEALETDTQQRNDAILKAIGIAYMAHRAFDGSIPERAAAFQRSAAGQAILTYYAAIEVGLPFADNALTASGDLLSGLLSSNGAAQVRRLAGMAGGRSLAGATEMLSALTGPLQSAVQAVSPHVSTVADAARKYVPAAIGTADKVAGVVAAAADVMPVYRLLGARLAAESAVIRAMA
ncbi:MAG: hypothetical protein ACI8RZ_000689 [Myxococcota bacterium]|jgi:hypothetical protein